METALIKIQKDFARLENELDVYKNSKSISEACKEIVVYIEETPEPFAKGYPEPNPYTAASGGGCTIS